MPKIKTRNQKGFTLVELMMTIGIAAVVMSGVAIMLADNLIAWRTMYSRLHSNEAENVYAVRRLFDRVVRGASATSPVYTSDDAAQVDYFEYPDSGSPYKCRANFSYSNNTLTVQCVKVSDGQVLESATIPNITQCNFKSSGRSIQMLLTINNASSNPDAPFSETLNVVTTAYLTVY